MIYIDMDGRSYTEEQKDEYIIDLKEEISEIEEQLNDLADEEDYDYEQAETLEQRKIELEDAIEFMEEQEEE